MSSNSLTLETGVLGGKLSQYGKSLTDLTTLCFVFSTSRNGTNDSPNLNLLEIGMKVK
jgi:hypothetical protein